MGTSRVAFPVVVGRRRVRGPAGSLSSSASANISAVKIVGLVFSTYDQFGEARRRDRRTRGAPPGRHHRSVVASHRSRHPHRVLQLQVGGLQPPGKTPGSSRFWVPQPRQPTPTPTVVVYPSTSAGLSREKHVARLSVKSQVTLVELK